MAEIVEIAFQVTIDSRSLLTRLTFVVFSSGRDDHRDGLVAVAPKLAADIVQQLDLLGVDPLVVTSDSS